MSETTKSVPTPGIHYGIDPAVYHGWDALSHSWMNKLRITPAHLADYMTNGSDESEDRDGSLAFGSAVHCKVLEPLEYDARFAVRPEGQSGATKEGKAFKADAQAHGQAILAFKQGRWVDAVARRAAANNRVGEWLARNHETEVSMVWERDGYMCKCRADLMVNGLNVLADLKTTITASPAGFAAQIAKYGYHLQADWYLDGVQRLTGQVWDWHFIACEKRRPFLVSAHQLVRDSAAHVAARTENDRLFELYKKCRSTGQWPGYPDTTEIVLPEWALGECFAGVEDEQEVSFD